MRQCRRYFGPRGDNPGGVFSMEIPTHVSNVMLVDPSDG